MGGAGVGVREMSGGVRETSGGVHAVKDPAHVSSRQLPALQVLPAAESKAVGTLGKMEPATDG